MMNQPPNDVRFFVHKRIIRGVKTFVSSGFNPVAAAGSFLVSDPGSSRGRSPRRAAICGGKACGATSVVDPRTCNCVPRSTALALAPPPRSRAAVQALSVGQVFGRCIPPFFSDGRGGCELDLVPGPGGGGTGAARDIGETVMGRYGAGEVPGNQPINRAVCRRGMVLGNDGVCYNKTQISNKEREWPRGRRPLLTGGDMRAISTAARAGRRLEGATKRLQKIGLMKKPARGISRRQIAAEIRTEMHHSK